MFVVAVDIAIWPELRNKGVMNVFKEGNNTISQLWDWEIASVDGESLSLGRVAIAAALFLIGIALSRRLSILLGQRLLRRMHISEGARGVIEGLLFYFFLAFFTLFSLKLANVPLTIFAVLGGALAIGVGFGSQNIVNNFISGIILMIEQPVKVGDIVQVNDTLGNIERIGGRSTLIKTPANTHIVVPNSLLLDNPVKNLTLENAVIRDSISVGVAYGSDVRQVEKTLIEVAKDCGGVLKSPKAWVMFQDFGDSALIFELNYWVSTPLLTERKKVESRLRFAVWESFKTTAIEIAFPQLDVHLRTSGAVEPPRNPPPKP